MTWVARLRDLVSLGSFHFDQQAEGAKRRMADFDTMPDDERALANEYGVNVVRYYKAAGCRGDGLREACERHRANKQQESFMQRRA